MKHTSVTLCGQAESGGGCQKGAGMAETSERLEQIDEVSKRLAVSTFTVRRLIKAKQLRAVRVGKRVLIPTGEIERVIREGCGPHASAPEALQDDALDVTTAV